VRVDGDAAGPSRTRTFLLAMTGRRARHSETLRDEAEGTVSNDDAVG